MTFHLTCDFKSQIEYHNQYDFDFSLKTWRKKSVNHGRIIHLNDKSNTLNSHR